jgi:hypothetical protein
MAAARLLERNDRFDLLFSGDATGIVIAIEAFDSSGLVSCCVVLETMARSLLFLPRLLTDCATIEVCLLMKSGGFSSDLLTARSLLLEVLP